MTAAMKKVLVVDDDPVIGRSFERVLSPKGYAVITAHSGEEALARLHNEHYDVVYTDIKMPGMDGLEVARRLKASRPWLPVVIVTGYGTQANEDRARRFGVEGFMRKPLSPEMIEASAARAFPIAALPAPEAGETPAAAAPAKGRVLRWLKNAALLFAAPFIGLGYVIALPFAGLFALGWVAREALHARGKRDRQI